MFRLTPRMKSAKSMNIVKYDISLIFNHRQILLIQSQGASFSFVK